MVFVARNSPKSSHDHSWHQKSSREGTKPTRDKATKFFMRGNKTNEKKSIKSLHEKQQKCGERKKAKRFCKTRIQILTRKRVPNRQITFFVIFGFNMLIEFN
ncbi:uncharacterized protein LOC144716785 isoform X2 [Wolffia australiana]